MNGVSTLESLPNEILMNLCEYFDARELYSAFVELNARFNRLVRSMPYLFLQYRAPHDTNTDSHALFAAQLYALMIYSERPIKLSSFVHIRRLTIWYPSDEQVQQIDGQCLPSLTYLSVSYTVAKASICLLYQKIFSNEFPALKSCLMYGSETPRDTLQWTQSPRLEHVHIRSNYSSVLTACPNLHTLNLSLTKLPRTSIDLRPHANLRRIRLVLTSIIWLEDERNFRAFFSAVPNVEELSFHKIYSITNSIDELLEYDWLASVLADSLSTLKQFTYHLYICNLFNIDQTDFNRRVPEIQTSFYRAYSNARGYRLKIEEYD